MDIETWLHSKSVIEKSKKSYAHFDYRTDIGQQRDYISNPINIAKHGFYPFIHYEIRMVKYNRTKGKKTKTRDICYAAHIDRCIYQYYSFILNSLYNERLRRDGLDDVAVAYRTDTGKSNIHLSKSAFDTIKASTKCYVMIGDFTGFFDNLNHRYLKTQWCSLLGVSELPYDHYKIFKSVTSYSTWELTDLLKINELDNTSYGRRVLNSKTRVLDTKSFRKNKSYIHKNTNDYGIPQGSPVSAILANIYMLEIDKKIKEKVDEFGGFYMRYSDDFMIVLPTLTRENAIKEVSHIQELFNSAAGLTLEPSKTQYFFYDGLKVINCGADFHDSADCSKRFINFLGFTFDGEKITVRAKTTAKYYYRMYRKAKSINKSGGISPNGKHISGRNLYERYSIRGAKGKKGNYLTYVLRAKKVFGDNEAVDREVKRHMQKIRKALNKRR